MKNLVIWKRVTNGAIQKLVYESKVSILPYGDYVHVCNTEKKIIAIIPLRDIEYIRVELEEKND